MGLLAVAQSVPGRLRVARALASKPLPLAEFHAFDRVAPAAWQAALDAAFPPTDRQGRLVLVWDAGDRWEPINRWTIMEMQPWPFVESGKRASYNGPHPRTNATLEAFIGGQRVNIVLPMPKGTRFVLKGPHMAEVDRLQWETHHAWRRQGVLGAPVRFWVIEGTEGGYPYRLTPAERSLWKMQGKLDPRPGDLPFADFDERTIAAIRAYVHRVGPISDTGSAHHQAARQYIARQQSAELETNRLYVQQLDAVVDEQNDRLRVDLKRIGYHNLRRRPVGVKPLHLDVDRIRDEFLKHTHTESLR